MAMELPPGWRGYGEKNYIPHPDTARRETELAALEAGLEGSTPEQREQALMPFRHLLPAHLRGPNQRLGDT
jgi:fumarate reductase flavoprotein subunit